MIAADGTTAATLVTDAQLSAGAQSARWSGEGLAGVVADGTYTVRLLVRNGLGQMAERSGAVTIVRAVRKLRLSRSAAGRDDAVIVSWQQSALATMTAELSSARVRAPLLSAVLAPGPQTFTLDAGRLAALPDGNYVFDLRGQTAVGTQLLRASFRLDRRPPSVQFVRLRVRGRSAFLVVRLSEAATVRVLAGARIVVPRRPRAAGLNGFRIRLPAGVPPRLRLQLVDPSGNSARAGPFRAKRR